MSCWLALVPKSTTDDAADAGTADAVTAAALSALAATANLTSDFMVRGDISCSFREGRPSGSGWGVGARSSRVKGWLLEEFRRDLQHKPAKDQPMPHRFCRMLTRKAAAGAGSVPASAPAQI